MLSCVGLSPRAQNMNYYVGMWAILYFVKTTWLGSFEQNMMLAIRHRAGIVVLRDLILENDELVYALEWVYVWYWYFVDE